MPIPPAVANKAGPDPERRSYSSLVSFSDPDGNGWLIQEVTSRLPGRVCADQTTFTSSSELATALRRAAAAHGEHEKRIGERDAVGLVFLTVSVCLMWAADRASCAKASLPLLAAMALLLVSIFQRT